MSRARPNPFVFVVGCPRSGTTLLQRMLDHHPQLAVVNDSNFIYKGLKACDPDWQTLIKQGGDPPLTPDLVEFVRTYKRFARQGVPDDDVHAAAQGARTWSEFVRRIYDVIARLNGKAHAGEKTPDYVRRLPFLHRLFPTTPIVHIIRDGRDVALSTLEWAKSGKGPGRLGLWQEESIAVCAMWWCWHVASGRRDGAAFGSDAYLEVRYEELVAEPEAVLRRITDFIGLAYDPAMLDYHAGRASYEPTSSAKSAWLPPTQGLRDWSTQMSTRDLELFEALAGEMLYELGYRRGAPRIPDDVTARAAHCRRWWHSTAARE